MSAWARRQVRKTTAVKSRVKPPEGDTEASEGEEEGEATSPDGGAKEEAVSNHPPEQAEVEPEPGPPAGAMDSIPRYNSCRDGPSRVTIRVGFDVDSPAQALLEACRLRSRMGALSILREPDGVTLDLSCQSPSVTRSPTEFFASLQRRAQAVRQQAPLSLGMRNALQR